MEEESDNHKRHSSQRRPVLLLWIVLLLLLILLTVITVVGVRLLDQNSGDVTSQLRGLGILVGIITVLVLFIGSLQLYVSVRYIQLPVWRWIASGFHGKLVLPSITKSKRAKTKRE